MARRTIHRLRSPSAVDTRLLRCQLTDRRRAELLTVTPGTAGETIPTEGWVTEPGTPMRHHQVLSQVESHGAPCRLVERTPAALPRAARCTAGAIPAMD